MTTAIATCALKASVLGAGVGLVVGVAQGLIRAGRGGCGGDSVTSALVRVDGMAAIERFDRDLYDDIHRLGVYQKYNPGAFARLCANWKNFIEAYDAAHSGAPCGAGAPYSANRFVANAVEALRELGKKVEHAAPGRVADFDEHAAKIQQTLRNYNNNIVLVTQDRLDT